MNIVIIDYGLGNVKSIQNQLKRISAPSTISSDKRIIEKADKLILPGVGHFEQGMKSLRKSKLIETLTDKVLNAKTPILGICLGMQLFTEMSEEGHLKGLGWIKAKTIRFNHSDCTDKRYRIPHIGWNNLQINKENKLLEGITEDSFFYFVHSYHVVCENENDILTNTKYAYSFTSAVHNDNIWGTQFHPEKSHQDGLRILNNFINI
jgi:imidazole glycerol-phosphate synthase subunit HisH